MSEQEEAEARAEIRNRLAAYLLHQTRSVVEELYPTVPARWGGGEPATEKLGLPTLPREFRDEVYAELHRVAVRVVNPTQVFTDDEIDQRIIDEETKE